jgi:trimeric autotransporter adhesin
MMNIYNGNVVTDGSGTAIVTMPSYFESLNRDFRYQLTIMGHEFAQALVDSEIANGSFTIKTDKPNIKVSWQVTGVRQDA